MNKTSLSSAKQHPKIMVYYLITIFKTTKSRKDNK